MSSDIDNVEEIDNKFQHAFESGSAGNMTSNAGDSSALKSKFKQDSTSRKRLEQKLEDSRVHRQVREFDFDDYED
jgi:hypothetical protein